MVQQRPTRARFRGDNSRAALALDPNGSGLLATVRRGGQPQPGAFGFFDCPPPVAFDPEAVEDGVAVLALTGPLEHHESYIWQSYETLTREIECALADPQVCALVLKIDSPGGVAAGMGECHKAIRRLSKAHGKPVYGYADQMACSAGYNVISACAEVWTSEEGVLGSIGVILCTIDETAALKKAGISIRYVVTGTRKADLHPGAPVTSEILDVAQAKVDYLGGLFFASVDKARGLKTGSAEALQAAVFHGPGAVKAGLCDGVAGWDAFFRYVKASVRATVTPATATPAAGARKTGAPGGGKAKAMAKKTPTKLQAVAAAETDGKGKRKALGVLTSLASLLGIGAADASMKKITKTSKHVTMEESDESGEESGAKSSEEEEEESASTMKSGPESSAASSSAKSSEEEEEEEEGVAAKAKAKAKPAEEEEEEEEETTAKAWTAAHRAYKGATKGVDAYAVHGPRALLAAVLKATGQTTVTGAMGALAAFPRRHAADAATIARVAKLETDGRKARVDAIVKQAKVEGRAPTKAMRVSLRALGAEKGTTWLRGHVATLPAVVRTKAQGAFVPRAGTEGEVIGAADTDMEKMLAQMTAGLDPKAAAEMRADFIKRLAATTAAGPKH